MLRMAVHCHCRGRFGTKSSLVLFLYCVYNTLICSPIYGQQTPYAIVSKFDRTVSYRTNVCDRQLMLYNGTTDLPNALQGLNLTISITNYKNGKETLFFSLNPNTGAIDETNPGVFALILDEIAIRAGFQWRNTYIAYPALDPTVDGNRTWTDILSWATHTFDISMERWAQTIERLAIPTSFPISWYDNSIVLGELVKPSSKSKPVFDVWSFLDPFQLTLWVSLLCCIAITGIVYYILELWNANADEMDLECKPIASIFYAAITFTGHYELRPQTHPARLVGFSFTFWSLIVGAAYTANLASFLVSPRTTSFKYNSIEKILKNKANVCVQKGGAIGKLLSQLYPEIKLVPKFPDEEIYKGLRYPYNQGGCDVVAHQFNTFEIYENLRETNADCTMRSEKRILEVIPAGLATAVDTGSQYCTSLISHVLDYHITSMLDDGFIERIWKSQLDRIATVSCAVPNKGGSNTLSEDDTVSLTIQDVGGIFIVHVVLSFVAIFIAAIQFYYTHKKGALNDDRTLSSVFGISQAKLVIERHLSQRDLTKSSEFFNTNHVSSLSSYKRTNPDLLNPKQEHSTDDSNNNNETFRTIEETPSHSEDLQLKLSDGELFA
jgi:Ligand-gated ion channel